MILAAADPLEHALPHALHAEPLIRFKVASEETSIPALWIKDPKRIPIPAPTPANAIRALPAPINFAACTMCDLKKKRRPIIAAEGFEPS